VLSVLEAQMLVREFDSFANVRLAVATAARSLVVRLYVATAASGFRRQAHRFRAGGGDLRVTLHAVDAAQHVCAMLEGMRVRRALQAEEARTRGERQ
jgi:hypothetical protein